MLLAKNDVPHRGELVLTGPDGENNQGIHKLMPGVAVKMFDVPIILRVRGENVLYFNVKDRGIVTVTGGTIAGQLGKTVHQARALCFKAMSALRDVLGCDHSAAGGKEVQHVEDE